MPNFFLLVGLLKVLIFIFFFQAEDGIRVRDVTGVQTCALPILLQRRFSICRRHDPPASRSVPAPYCQPQVGDTADRISALQNLRPSVAYPADSTARRVSSSLKPSSVSMENEGETYGLCKR